MMIRVNKGELTVRVLIIIAVVLCFNIPLAFGKSGTSFDEFIRSREIVTTIYFQSNNEDLSRSERKRLSGTIDKLRELQNNGRMIRVEGFSSPEGDQEKNFSLSFFRARSVAVLIEAKGLPAEVALTGYGDLRASSDNPKLERRVEIASYIKPVGMKKIKVADKNKQAPASPEFGSLHFAPVEKVIDSYSVDQAIRNKIDNKNKGIAEQNKELEEELSPGLSQMEKDLNDSEILDRGYSLWRKSVDPSYSPKVSQSEKPSNRNLNRGYSQHSEATDRDLKRGYSQSKEAIDRDLKRGYSQSKEAIDRDLKRGYSQSKEAIDRDLKRGYSQSEEAIDKDLKRGYSLWQKDTDHELSPGVTLVSPVDTHVIDALMIEQAIMDKIGAALPAPSGTVTQIGTIY